ncbi:hypothetical protein CKAH01_08097 [Colletotrichum kahawae]|uniref:Uncharacterized protein n=1 Tax=Colletotrichum kahawae TaxID=34407 RepID=A0AAD9Y1W3_COLKA|nr:hypothetical protein CKAH01_08097 [Colletotrichum kahawae]
MLVVRSRRDFGGALGAQESTRGYTPGYRTGQPIGSDGSGSATATGGRGTSREGRRRVAAGCMSCSIEVAIEPNNAPGFWRMHLYVLMAARTWGSQLVQKGEMEESGQEGAVNKTSSALNTITTSMSFQVAKPTTRFIDSMGDRGTCQHHGPVQGLARRLDDARGDSEETNKTRLPLPAILYQHSRLAEFDVSLHAFNAVSTRTPSILPMLWYMSGVGGTKPLSSEEGSKHGYLALHRRADAKQDMQSGTTGKTGTSTWNSIARPLLLTRDGRRRRSKAMHLSSQAEAVPSTRLFLSGRATFWQIGLSIRRCDEIEMDGDGAA